MALLAIRCFIIMIVGKSMVFVKRQMASAEAHGPGEYFFTRLDFVKGTSRSFQEIDHFFGNAFYRCGILAGDEMSVGNAVCLPRCSFVEDMRLAW